MASALISPLASAKTFHFHFCNILLLRGIIRFPCEYSSINITHFPERYNENVYDWDGKVIRCGVPFRFQDEFMIERYYTYTVSHCLKAIKYGLHWLLSELEKYNSVRGCILAVGKGNFCDKSTEVYKEGIGEGFVKKMCKDGYVKINGKRIDLQYPRNMHISSFISVVAIYPYKKLINKIEKDIAFSHHTDRLYLPTNPNALPKSLLIIPWSELDVDEWIEKYKPHRIDIDCAEYYKFGSCRIL